MLFYRYSSRFTIPAYTHKICVPIVYMVHSLYVCEETGTLNSFFLYYFTYSIRITVTPRAACAPITNACSMSAVLLGPEIKTPYP